MNGYCERIKLETGGVMDKMVLAKTLEEMEALENEVSFHEGKLAQFHERLQRLHEMVPKGPTHQAGILAAIEATENDIRIFEEDLQSLELKLRQATDQWVTFLGGDSDLPSRTAKVLRMNPRVVH